MDKTTKVILTFLIFLIQLLIVFGGIIQKEIVLKTGEEVRFKVKPIDPYDAFRGRYVTLNFDSSVIVNEEDKYKKKDKVYAVLKQDSNGFYDVDFISKEKPENKKYIKTSIKYIYSNQATLELPFDRYYIEEKYAKPAENIYRNATRGEKTENVYIKVKIWNGNAVIEDMYVDDKNIIEYINLNSEKLLAE